MSFYSETRTAAEHLQLCKDRAYEYLDRGEHIEAWTSFVSDMRKHQETESHPALQLGMMLLIGGHNDSVAEMRKFIEGFN